MNESKVKIFGYWDMHIKILGFLIYCDIVICGYWDIWILQYWNIEVWGYLDIRILRYTYLDIWDIWVLIY